MPSYMVRPPAFHLRMSFMDSMEEMGVYYYRDPEGYLVVVGKGQEPLWERLRERFSLVAEEDPPMVPPGV
ncbi:MAG: hypothetical protein HY685_04595 [Chloroflexi bacterium]|nr:hypothetical protein [Chloroflexota bacterium]